MRSKKHYSAADLFEVLNASDECSWIEAKGSSESSHTLLETVCAYCNEPGLGGGAILVGVTENSADVDPRYIASGVADVDKFQKDFATQCATSFNRPIRPEIFVETVLGKIVIRIWVSELPSAQKPLYFTTEGLPRGVMRRIASTDQHCTEDDLRIFYADSTSFDQTPVLGVTYRDCDEHAIKLYRSLREKVNPAAEELAYDDAELLAALGCVNKENASELNLAGLLLFGSSNALRRTYPMIRVDYIRVPGTTWIQDPDNRFVTIDMRGSLIMLLYRLVDAIHADLPKGFLLPEGQLQAGSNGLPVRALREAIVNALMHRSYREHRPTQVIRYDNRIEIVNPGFSLKDEDNFGCPGSEVRNPLIAAVFHDTQLAETKGSGIRTMRRLMEEAHLALPTFESSRDNNEFTVRLLLHHFLGEEDLKWLRAFDDDGLNDAQKRALIFVRETGAIDNLAYRQMGDCDTLKASKELNFLREKGLLHSKGKGKATYYVSGQRMNSQASDVNTHASGANTHASGANTHASGANTHDPKADRAELPTEIIDLLRQLKKRESSPEKLSTVICGLCLVKPMTKAEIAKHVNRKENYIMKNFLVPMVAGKKLRHLYPEMIKHPHQAYITVV